MIKRGLTVPILRLGVYMTITPNFGGVHILFPLSFYFFILINVSYLQCCYNLLPSLCTGWPSVQLKKCEKLLLP